MIEVVLGALGGILGVYALRMISQVALEFKNMQSTLQAHGEALLILAHSTKTNLCNCDDPNCESRVTPAAPSPHGDGYL